MEPINKTVRMRQGKEGYLKKDRKERFNLKRGWFVNAWRIVNKDGDDLVQPWSNTKKEARETAKQLGIRILGELEK